jgi:hypothetical protein
VLEKGGTRQVKGIRVSSREARNRIIIIGLDIILYFKQLADLTNMIYYPGRNGRHLVEPSLRTKNSSLLRKAGLVSAPEPNQWSEAHLTL